MKRSTNRCSALLAFASVLASAWLLVAAEDAWAIGGVAMGAGKNANGQLGIGNTTDQNIFTNVPGTQDIVASSCGANHTILATSDGTVLVTGLNKDGQLGLGHNLDRSSFSIVQNIPKAVSVAGGGSHSLFAAQDGTVWVTGLNDQGQLGLGDYTPRNLFTQATTLGAIVAVAAGEKHSLALDAFGNVYSCGANGNGQLGIGSVPPVNINTWVPVPGVALIIAIACGWNHSMALDIFGNLFVWGADGNGQLGINSNLDRAFPVFAGGGVVMIAGGGSHSIVETGDGTIWTTGRNAEGQLGQGDNVERYVFTAVDPKIINNADSIACGKNHTLLVSTGGSSNSYIYDCGINSNGELGFGDLVNRIVFTRCIGAGGSAGTVSGGEGHSLCINSLVSSFQFAESGVTVDESAGTLTIEVVLKPASRQPCTVDYNVTGGTAILGTDFTFTPGTLTFAAGQTRKSFTLAITDDALSEDTETIEVSLLNPNPVAVGAPGVYTIRINDNDPLPTVAFGAATFSTDENIPHPAIPVQLSAPAGRDIQVTCKATGGTALPGIDYRLDATLIKFPAGTVTADVPITIIDNAVPNLNKTVQLTLSAPKNAALGPISVDMVTIVDDEAPLIQFSAAASSVQEAATTQDVTVTLARAYTLPVTVNYSATGGTAISGVQYALAPGTLTFNPGVTSQTITVTIADDAKAGPDVTVIIGLSSPTNGFIGTPGTHTLSILDNADPILAVQSSNNLSFGTVGVGAQKIIQNAYTLRNVGGGTLHATVSSADPPFQILDAKGVPAYSAQFTVASGQMQKVSVSCVPYTVGTVSRILTFTGDGKSTPTTRTATCTGIVQATITKIPTSVTRGSTVIVYWTVDGGTPTHNDVHWATSLAGLTKPQNKTAQSFVTPYMAWFRAPTAKGTVYVKVHTVIEGKTYYSPVKTIAVK